MGGISQLELYDMYRRRKKSEDDANDRELDESFPQVDEEDDGYGDFDEFQEEYDEQEKAVLTPEKKKEYYVKSEDLVNEIRKYQESKKNSPDRKGQDLRRASD